MLEAISKLASSCSAEIVVLISLCVRLKGVVSFLSITVSTLLYASSFVKPETSIPFIEMPETIVFY